MGFHFVSENSLNDLRKKDLLLLKDVFFAVTYLGRGGSVPGWDLVSKLNEQINELWEFRMDWFFGWTRSGQFRKLISSGEQEGKVNTMQLGCRVLVPL